MDTQMDLKYDIKRKLLINSLIPLLEFDAWDNQLIIKSEQACNFEIGYSNLLFPGGISEIMDYYHQHLDALMIEILQNEDSLKKIRERISKALIIRIKALVSKPAHIKNSSFVLHPTNTALGFKIAWRTCSAIWYYAGDNSIDYNYYSKRFLLLSVYLSAILFYISDESDQCIETEKFIEKSLANIVKIGDFKNLIKFPKIENIPILRMF